MATQYGNKKTQRAALEAMLELLQAVAETINRGATADSGGTPDDAMRLTTAEATAALGGGREVESYGLTDEECEAAGLPFGAREPCCYVLGTTQPDDLEAWDDGDGCFHVRAFGLSAEVHHKPRGWHQAQGLEMA